MPVIHRILAFGTFFLEQDGKDDVAACVFSASHPVYLLGRLGLSVPPPTPKHVPLVLPAVRRTPYYCYRQFSLGAHGDNRLLVFPSTDLCNRSMSFNTIDRLARLLSDKPDPYHRPRSSLLARRVLKPLFRHWVQTNKRDKLKNELSVLDVGAGTGHLSAKAVRHVLETIPSARSTTVGIHFVDTSGPTPGRSFGLSRGTADVSYVEWTQADYRQLLDDDQWLRSNALFDWVFLCRLLDNTSNFTIEPVQELVTDPRGTTHECLPHGCLAPSRQPAGVRRLAVRTVRRIVSGGTVMPQFSLSDYFRAMHAVMAGCLETTRENAPHLAVRRFNAASLTTVSGRSILAQLMKVAKAIVIEDLDLAPEHLVHHRRQFGLVGTAAVHCSRDGFVTEAFHHVITTPETAAKIRGDRLW